MTYIKPNLKSYSTLNELLESKESIFSFEPNISFDDLPGKQNILLVSEAGNGKTRLLKEYLLKNEMPGIFLDLKKIGNQDVEQYIKSIDFEVITGNEYSEAVDKTKSFRTNEFELKQNTQAIFCFDALDEVKNENFSMVVENIKKFIGKYSNSIILISCRKNYLNKWQHLFSEMNLSYVEIYPLNTQKIKEFLSSFKIEKNQIDELLGKLQFQNRQLIIQTPRYLEMIGSLAEKEGIDRLKKISRSELFERFIYQKLNIESEKINDVNNKEIIKKVLEKLALIMEIYQSNQITKDELMEFFDDTNSNLNISFLNQVSINSFYERSLLRDNIDLIEFENTEFQEYLAAKEILRLGRVEQVIFDLAIVPELEEVHPSWINTLSFVIEQDIKFLKQIFDYIFSNKDKVHIEDHIRLLTKYNIEKLSSEERISIFKMVYSFYQENGHWIDYDTAEKLSFYYDESLYEYLKKNTTNKSLSKSTKKITKANNATIVAFLIEREQLGEQEKEEWKFFLKKFLNEKDQHEVVLKRSLFALGKFKDAKLFNKRLIDKIFQTGEDTIITNLIYALEDINPNSPIAYRVFLKGIKGNNISARHSLYKAEKSEAIKEILKVFIEDDVLLHEFLEHESIFRNDDDKLVENIEKVTDDQIIKLLKKLVLSTFDDRLWYKAEKSNFIHKIVSLIEKYSPNYIFELIKKCNKDKLWSCKSIFAILLKKKDVEKFIIAIKKIDDGSNWIAFQVLQSIKYSQRDGNEEIYESGRKFLTNEYTQAEKRESELENDQNRKGLEIYTNFKHRLEPEKDKYIPNVFRFYIDNKEKLTDFITDEDKARLEKLIKESIFEKFDPGAQILKINKRENGSTSYTTHEWIFIFGSCIGAANELGLDVSLYRQKILNYIPFAYDNDREAIFSLIPNPTEEELNNVLSIFVNRKDDLEQFMPSSTIDFIKNYKISSGLPLLKKFVDLNTISLYERKSALTVISEIINSDENYFKDIFERYKSSDSEDKELAEMANGILIKRFKNADAIKWRFEELISRAFPFKRPKGVHSVGRGENELDNKEFAQPLTQLKDIQYKNQFLNLLKNSLEIIAQGDDFYSYTNYIWTVVIDYFKNLKELRSYEILNDLDIFITENHKKDGINWFKYLYQQLKLEYLIYIGKPKNISDCIKQYNFFKERIYLSVATPRDLLEITNRIIQEDLKKWIEDEGAYKFIHKESRQEDLIQKTIQTQFENGLLKAGLRKNEIHIQRESQLLDDKRTDFLISYGFIGPILIEIKLTKNDEITNKKKREKYKKKLIQYIEGTNSQFGVFIIFQTEEKNTIESYLPILQELYKSERNIEIKGLNCIKN